MDNVIADFERRCEEIDAYFLFLRHAVGPDAAIQTASAGEPQAVRSDTQMVLKAASFLILYNIVEATVRAAMAQVYHAIKTRAANFEQVTDEIRRFYVGFQYAKRFSDPTVANMDSYRSHALYLIEAAIRKEVLDIEITTRGWGSLDAKRIRELSARLGIDLEEEEKVQGGGGVHIVKLRRNHLAHGELTFSEVGREYSFESLDHTRQEVQRFMHGFLKRFKKFVDGGKFIRQAAAA